MTTLETILKTPKASILSSLVAVAMGCKSEEPSRESTQCNPEDKPIYEHAVYTLTCTEDKTAPDGCLWENLTLVKKYRSVPAGIVLPDETVFMVDVKTDVCPEVIACSYSTDGGISFTDVACAIDGERGKMRVDPFIRTLSASTYILGYFEVDADLVEEDPAQVEEWHRIDYALFEGELSREVLSELSTTGGTLSFTEKGTLFEDYCVSDLNEDGDTNLNENSDSGVTSDEISCIADPDLWETYDTAGNKIYILKVADVKRYGKSPLLISSDSVDSFDAGAVSFTYYDNLHDGYACGQPIMQGTRGRLYCSMQFEGQTSIGSLVTDNGLTWQEEKGTRYETPTNYGGEQKEFSDTQPFYTKGQLNMFVKIGSGASSE